MVPRSDEHGSDDKALPDRDSLPGAAASESASAEPPSDPDVPDLKSDEPGPAEPLAMPPDAAAEDATDPMIDTERPPSEAPPEAAASTDTERAPSEAAAIVDAEPAWGAEAGPDGEPSRETPLAAADAGAQEEQEQHEQEEGSSLAAKLLTALVLLLAGAGLGIWAAPKVAQVLPAGMAPVADWLTPGGRDAEARLAALETRLDAGLRETGARIDAVAERPEPTAAIGEAVNAGEARLRAEIDSLRDTVESNGGAALGERLGQIETTLDGQVGELAALREQLSGGAAAATVQGQEAAARIDVYRAELDGLRAEFERLSGQVGSLSGRVDEVAAAADRSISAAEAEVRQIEAAAGARTDAARVSADVAGIRAALASGQPFAAEAERLQASGGVALPEGLAASAEAGAPTLAELQQSFPDAAHAAIKAAILAGAGDGFLARTRAYVEAQVASRSLTPQPGNGPDALLSRMEDRLRAGDLAAALSEADGLPSEASAAMASWLEGARARQAADAALATLGSSLPATD